ncbi:MAG TPA: hypothetical protein VFY00_07255 [Arenimonas sp.]|nr:hypothetical protein [Arenimonas sp.]
MNLRPIRIHALLLLLLLATLAGCGSATKTNPRDEMLYHYVSVIRWSEFDVALSFIDPKVLEADPVSSFELERYKQFKVSGYEVKNARDLSEDEYEQVVEIRLVNNNTQVEKIITDRQLWRWDPEAKRWWLASGLPDLDAEVH